MNVSRQASSLWNKMIDYRRGAVLLKVAFDRRKGPEADGMRVESKPAPW